MIKILTPRIKLFPLSKQQLFEFLYAPEKLEKDLTFPISRSIVDTNLKSAIGYKLEKMQKSEQPDHHWQTYWLLQTLEPSFGAGLLGFKEVPDAYGRVEIGYGIDLSVQGQGLMTEAVSALCEWAFEQSNCSLITTTSQNNPVSMHVLEKSGFRLMGHNPESSLWHRYKTGSIIFTSGDNRKFEPIGIIHTGYENAAGTPIQPSAAQESFGTIILRPELVGGLKDLDAFSHIILLYVFDRIQKFKLNVKPLWMTRNMVFLQHEHLPAPIRLVFQL
jgi:RimJ/RimL family protein N-acetyltransferase